ncbi:pectate lyase family protein [Cellulomonas fulva]|uniref:pectate lyase family protein n=1 Tax=Cellulomonas fulva TaxID=2835530 RepID=UPI0027DD0D71|nr:cellulose binding domain-containing protein [Cellulomonas fulva]
MAVAAALGITSLTAAQAATGGVTGYATQNGGTTGGAGGAVVTATTGTAIHQALCSRASDSTPITIQVSGTITVGNTAKVSGDSCNTAAGVIELKQVSNVTLVGVGSGATFDQIGIHIREAKNIVIQNVTVKNVKKSGSPTSNGGDAIGMESSVSNVWVDHVTLEAAGGESEGFDGLFDMKAGVKYVTLSYSVLRNSGRGGLVGSSDSDLGNGPVTFHHNKYENIDSRTPLLRGATAHIYNNWYHSLNESGINPRAGGKAKVENNYFEDSKDVLGTFYTDLPGTWQTSGNILDNVTWSPKGEDMNPAGPAFASTTSFSVPYSYTLNSASCVPDIVSRTAGANKGLQVADGSCNPVTPTPTPTTTTSPTPTPTPTTTPTSNPTTPPSGTNLSIGAGADGSSKASGTSYGNVVDGSTSTYWSPVGTTGRISVKWSSAKTISSLVVVEAPGATGRIGTWRVLDGGTGAVLATGSGAGAIAFPATSLTKVTLDITGASGTPQVAELQTYAGSGPTPTPTPTSSPEPTPSPTGGPTPGAGTLYVAPTGSASAAGTLSSPTTLESAISRVASGGEIFLRGGTYRLSQTVVIPPGKDGTAGDRTLLSAYPGETPVLDFSAQTELSTNRGLSLNADYWHLYGIVVQRAGDNGISLGGSNNVVERVVTRNNRDTGLQISRMASDTPKADWPSNNLVVSSESHDNVDSDGEDADGFAAKLTVGTGNVFRDTVSHHNIDDGWDLYTKTDTGAIGPVTIEHSLAFQNGTLSGGGQAGAGDRNGFKLGGEDIKVDHVVRNSYAVDNGKHGFTFNSNPGSMTISNNVSVGNEERNFNFDGGTSVFSGNVSCSSGSNDRIVGTDRGNNAFWSGSNSSACSAYSGALAWSFNADGTLRITFGGSSPEPTPTGTPTATTSPTPTTPSATPATPTPTGGGCSARVTEINSWGGGYQATVTVTAGAGTISRWTTSLGLASTGGVQGWSGTFSQSGSTLTVANAAWNGALGAGASTSYGWTGSGSAPTTATPVSCTAG